MIFLGGELQLQHSKPILAKPQYKWTVFVSTMSSQK